MKTIGIIVLIVAVVAAATYFGFIPVKGVPRGTCTGTVNGQPAEGTYAFGRCAT